MAKIVPVPMLIPKNTGSPESKDDFTTRLGIEFPGVTFEMWSIRWETTLRSRYPFLFTDPSWN